MFKHRSDGKYVKDIQPIFRLMPHIMKKRCDAQVYYKEDVSISAIDEYISKKAEEGIKLSYMNIVYAIIVRILAEKPRLNRFVMNGITYQRNKILISLAIKKGMSEDAPETIIKLPFNGTENIFEVKDLLDAQVAKNKDIENYNNTDGLAKALSIMPNWLIKMAVNLLIILDKYGIMPKAVIEASPFHASAFLTNVASIGIDSIYHHIYDFGTVGIFVAMGKKKKSFIYDDESFKEDKCISLSVVGDERICDGYYFASAMKLFKKYMKKPELLEEGFFSKEESVLKQEKISEQAAST